MTAPSLFHDRRSVESPGELIACFTDAALASPFRSTVPLLALLKDAWPTFSKVLSSCGMSGDLSVALERTVHSPKGEGRPSYTDAMVLSPTAVLAIEAKWTEPRYESVRTRLARKDSKGRDSRAVLEGWVELLGPFASRPLVLDEFSECVYQVLHRSASACGPERLPRLAYLHFCTTVPATQVDYVGDLTRFHRLLGSPEGFPFFVVDQPLEPTRAFRSIEGLKKGGAGTGRVVRDALLTEVLFRFGEPRVHRISASL